MLNKGCVTQIARLALPKLKVFTRVALMSACRTSNKSTMSTYRSLSIQMVNLPALPRDPKVTRESEALVHQVFQKAMLRHLHLQHRAIL